MKLLSLLLVVSCVGCTRVSNEELNYNSWKRSQGDSLVDKTTVIDGRNDPLQIELIEWNISEAKKEGELVKKWFNSLSRGEQEAYLRTVQSNIAKDVSEEFDEAAATIRPLKVEFKK